MVKEVIHDPILLAIKSEMATIKDLQVAEDLLVTLVANKDGCVGMAGNRTKGPKKRTDQNDADFLKALLLCLE